MNKALSILLLTVLTMAAACADVVQYRDDAGRTHFVDNPDRVPEKYRDQIANSPKLRQLSRTSGGAKYEDRESSFSAPSTGNKKVEIFVTSWCPHCKELEEYLSDRHVRFKRSDIENDRSAHGKYQTLGGGGVPIITVGSKVIRGFQRAELDAALGIRVDS